MARLLVRLRLRILLNGLSVNTQQALGLVFGTIFGLFFSLLAFAILAASARDEGWDDVVTVALGALWIAWLLLPAISFTSDTTLDPRRFATFPISPRELVPGLLVASLVGVGPVATLIATSGLVVGAGRQSTGLVTPLATVLVVMFVTLTCVVWSRAVLAIASDLLTSRRGRDLAALLAMVAFAGVVFGPQLFTTIGLRPDLGQLSSVAEVLRWTPGGLGGSVISALLADDLLVAAAWLVALAATIPAGLVVWSLAVRRSQTVAPTSAAGAGTSTSLYQLALRWLPRGRLTAVAARFLRTLVRDARVRMQLLSLTFVMVPLYVFSAGAIPGPTAPLYASYLVLPFGMAAANQYGLDGPALWQHQLAGDEPVRDLLGRNLALVLVALPLAVVGSVGLAAAFDAWQSVPTAVLLSTAVMLVLLGVSNAAAALVPYPIPEDPSNLFTGGGTGTGFVQGLQALVVILVHGVLVLPVFLGTFLVPTATARLAAAAGSLAYGLALLAGGTAIGAAVVRGRGPEILARVDPRGA